MRPRIYTPARRLRGERGATMVETLVALVVLSVGLLGIAALFVTSIRAARSSVSRMQAVNLVADLSERIRANRAASVAYNGAAANNGCIGGAIGAVNCTAVAMAAKDLWAWNQQIAATWPGGAANGVVAVVAGPPDSYTITISWTEAGEPAPLSYTANFQL